ncbi:metallophosphoesterase [Paenibacillus sp. TRM 82003]|nr:metallophosphoesterase [Paenibacillus sp. TRM 82003]
MNGLLYFLSFIVVCVAVYFLFIFPTQWVKVERIRVPLGLGVRIVQISDLHVEKLRVSPERLRTLVECEKPDYLFLTGDYTQRLRYVPKVDLYLKELQQVGVPIYAVLGNHDYRLRWDMWALFDIFRKRDIPLLQNEAVRMRDFTIIGIDDLVSGRARASKAFQDVGHDEKTIVITHDPNISSKIRQPFDYLMSGHLHGKQFQVPFLYYFKEKGPLARKGIYKGLHRNAYGTFYISKGIGQAQINARFLVRSEITVHEL